MSQSVRHIWVIKLPSGQKKSSSSSASLIFHRKFPTVEKRARQIHGKNYTPVPPPNDLIPLLLQKIDRTYTGSQFIPTRDRCDRQVQRPVYKISCEGGVLWPLVAVQKDGFLYCCLPLVSATVTEESFSPVNELSVPLALALLSSVEEFLRVPVNELSVRVSELTSFLNEAAPFGQLRDASAEHVVSRLADKSCVIPKSSKLPAWKSHSTKGKPTFHLCVSEYISASQCAQETWQDRLHVFGEVTCRSEVDGGVTDITLNLTHSQEGGLNVTPLDSLTLNPCVIRADWLDQDTDMESRLSPRRIRFCPPAESFTLCHYTASRLTELPIFGVYHMKPEESSASISAQLKLNDQIKNQFECLELRIPFYTRNAISGVDANPSQGSVNISSNKREIIWIIGPRITSKEQEVQLSATVTFSGTDQSLPAPSAEDAFCRGHNSYAQLHFKIAEFTHSGCCIDSKSVQVSPSTKIKLNISREYASKDYKIWNSSGEALVVDPNI